MCGVYIYVCVCVWWRERESGGGGGCSEMIDILTNHNFRRSTVPTPPSRICSVPRYAITLLSSLLELTLWKTHHVRSGSSRSSSSSSSNSRTSGRGGGGSREAIAVIAAVVWTGSSNVYGISDMESQGCRFDPTFLCLLSCSV